MKKFLWRRIVLSRQSLDKMLFLFIAAFMLWVKTYIAYKLCFDINTKSFIDEIVLLINPISFILFALGFGLFFKEKRFKRYTIIASFVITLILFADLVYYREFTDFITLPLILQTSNFDGLSSNVINLIEITDILLFLDIPILIYLARKKPHISKFEKFVIPERLVYFCMVCIIAMFNYGLASTQRTELLTRTFDREIVVKYLGTYNYHLYDIALQTKSTATKAMANSNQLVEIEEYLSRNDNTPNPEYFGIAKGRNIIVVHLESLQSFVIDNYVGEDEITPFLNDFIKESYYFDNFYHQVSQGKSSDAEFLYETSLYPLDRGAVFFTHVNNKFFSLTNILRNHGYYTAAFHGNNASFWNRDIMYDNFGYNKFFAKPYYNVTEENSINYGIKDIDFFEQSMELLKELPRPFYTKFITLTNHYSFELDEEDKMIQEFWSDDPIVNKYFTTVRYMDEALKIFVDSLKEEGLYDNSIIIMYGDHYGIAKSRKPAMQEYFGRELNTVDVLQLQRVPLIIHIPGVTDAEPKVFSHVGGQIDLKPTILHLMGIQEKEDIYFGSDLFARNRPGCVILRDGSFITEDYIYTNGTCYDIETGEAVDESVVEEYMEKSEMELYYSDQIIYGDLLRFYNKAVKASK